MIYGLPVDEARWVKKHSRGVEKLSTRVRRQPNSTALSQASIALSPIGGIAARSGTTAGSATVTLYYIDSGVLTAYSNEAGNSVTVTAYNVSDSEIPAGDYVPVHREYLSGLWIIGGAGGGGECTPTAYITALQVTATAIQYKSYDVATCTESGWTTLIELTSDCPITA